MRHDDPALFPAAATSAHDGLPLYRHLIGNRWVGSSAAPLPVVAPATATPFAWLSRGGADLELAASTAVQQQRILSFIDNAKRDGLPLLAQVLPAADLAPGWFVPPTVFGPVGIDNPLACQKAFGPVLAAQVFETEDDAVAVANGTDSGLVAGVNFYG